MSRYVRERAFRPIHPVIEIVCDDTHTAPRYFQVLKEEMGTRKVVRIVAATKNGATADDVLELAHTPQSEDQDQTFVLIDIDTNPDVGDIQAKAAQKKVSVLFSKPCFEIWTLSHLLNTGKAFDNCEAVLKELKIKWKQEFASEMGPKAQADYKKLMDRLITAIANCKNRNPDTNPSWSEVWRAVEAIIS